MSYLTHQTDLTCQTWDSERMGKTLVIVGLVIAAIGLVMMLGVPLGRLPGDIAVRRGNVSFYFPLTTSIVLSVVVTLVLAWFRR